MRKIFLCSLALILFIIQPAWAESKATALKKDEEAKQAEMRKKLEEKKAEINGSEWHVQVKQQAKVPGAKPVFGNEDVLTFQNGQFHSKSTEDFGYTPTNYTLTIQQQGPTVWETMQTSGKGEITFWRGEWTGEVMTGVMTRQVEEGKTEEYSFSTTSTKRISPTSGESGEGESKTVSPVSEQLQVLTSTPATSAPTASTRQESKKKKGGGVGGLWHS